MKPSVVWALLPVGAALRAPTSPWVYTRGPHVAAGTESSWQHVAAVSYMHLEFLTAEQQVKRRTGTAYKQPAGWDASLGKEQKRGTFSCAWTCQRGKGEVIFAGHQVQAYCRMSSSTMERQTVQLKQQ